MPLVGDTGGESASEMKEDANDFHQMHPLDWRWGDSNPRPNGPPSSVYRLSRCGFISVSLQHTDTQKKNPA